MRFRSAAVVSLATALVAFAGARVHAAPARHPLEPLDGAEIASAAALVRAHKLFPKGALFPLIALAEPSKKSVLAWKPGKALPREAEVVVLDRAANQTYAARVDLGKKQVTSWKLLPGVQPLVLVEEYETVPKIVKADAGWQAAMKKRGITDLDKVWVDVWAGGHFPPKGQDSARLLRAVSYLQEGAVNFYGRPIEGVTAVVNMNSEKVALLIDTGVVPVASEKVEFDEKSLGKRADLKPLTTTQAEGPSFTAKGHELSWQKWKLQWAMHPREGLVIYDLRYAGRRVMYRGALSEMVVPYGDAGANWVWRNAFDEGEYGVGRLASPIEVGLDAPATATLYDVPFSDDFGKAYDLARAVGVYERDGGILWKHYDIYHDKNETRRARELVVFFIATIGNYDYSVSWVLKTDGSIGVECALTGIMLAKGVPETKVAHGAGAHGHLVAKNVVAPHHQHFFNFRIDLDVDGDANTPVEMNTVSAPMDAKTNPFGNVMTMTETDLVSESKAQRELDMKSARMWRFENRKKTTALGYHPGYLLVPGGNTVPFVRPEAMVRKRAAFIDHHVWVTRYSEDERHAAGWYPSQAPPGEGLTKYVANDDKLVGQDVVLWYTVGVTHIPRPEEWPIMPAHHIGFSLMPAGFFDRNPALDVPRSPN